ncbi:hypothetical protein RCC89_03825 [Cytophagaceae bacterium ABcell3]|nr:hypothetical protein RCC89_03825 [Cytophagaceae bacterium ABcell3]
MSEGIEQYYGLEGDRDWENVIKTSMSVWKESDYQKELVDKLKGRKDLAIVIYDRLGEHSLDWLEKKVPGLEYLTPLECLKSQKLLQRLKEALMRMG